MNAGNSSGTAAQETGYTKLSDQLSLVTVDVSSGCGNHQQALHYSYAPRAVLSVTRCRLTPAHNLSVSAHRMCWFFSVVLSQRSIVSSTGALSFQNFEMQNIVVFIRAAHLLVHFYYHHVALLLSSLLHCALASGAVFCNRSCLCLCGGRAGGVCYHDNSKLRCIDRHQTGSVGAGSDHLQLIKFWRSCAPGKGVCGRAKIFGSALLRPARSVCVSPSAFLSLSYTRLLLLMRHVGLCLYGRWMRGVCGDVPLRN